MCKNDKNRASESEKNKQMKQLLNKQNKDIYININVALWL